MSVLSCILFLSLIGAALSSEKCALEKSQVVPDVLDTVPGDKVHVSYGTRTAQMGNTLTPTQVKDEPTSVTWPSNPHKLYTLVMVDPDAPSRWNHTMREYRHWLVVNIPGCNLAKGDTCSSYYGSQPPERTGYHRYTFAVYEQPDKINVDPQICEQEDMDRAKFCTKKFSREYHLGRPIAANFFYAKYDGTY